jgi:hypothetical protein
VLFGESLEPLTGRVGDHGGNLRHSSRHRHLPRAEGVETAHRKPTKT